MSKTHLLRFSEVEHAISEMKSKHVKILVSFESGLAVVRLPKNLDLQDLNYSESFHTETPRFAPETEAHKDDHAMVSRMWQEYEEKGPPPPPVYSEEELQEQALSKKERNLEELASTEGLGQKAKIWKYMTGQINVAFVVVDSTHKKQQFSIDEQYSAYLAAYNGIILIANQLIENEAHFHVFARYVKIDAENTPQKSQYSYATQIIRPAMIALKYPGSFNGADQYADDISKIMGADWGYVFFSTKYTIDNYSGTRGYADHTYSWALMKYTSNESDAAYTFSHETCHVFSALDEYTPDDPCSAKAGVFDTPNSNSDYCKRPLHLPCIMRKDGDGFCYFTRKQMGIGAWAVNANMDTLAGANSNARPSITAYKGALYIAYRGVYNDDLIYYTKSEDNGVTWLSHQALTGMHSKTAPTLAVHDDKLYIVFRGRVDGDDGQDEAIYYSFYDGKDWAPLESLGSTIGANSANSPALASYRDVLYMVFRGWDKNGNDQALYIATCEGGTWTPTKRLSDQIQQYSNTYPYLAVFNDHLYLFFQSTDNQAIRYARFNGVWDSVITDLNELVGARTGDGPCAVVNANRLYVLYKSANDNSLWCTYSEDAKAWTKPKSISAFNNAYSATGPSALGFPVPQNVFAKGKVPIDRLFMTFRGGGDDQIMYLTYYDIPYFG